MKKLSILRHPIVRYRDEDHPVLTEVGKYVVVISAGYLFVLTICLTAIIMAGLC